MFGRSYLLLFIVWLDESDVGLVVAGWSCVCVGLMPQVTPESNLIRAWFYFKFSYGKIEGLHCTVGCSKGLGAFGDQRFF